MNASQYDCNDSEHAGKDGSAGGPALYTKGGFETYIKQFAGDLGRCTIQSGRIGNHTADGLLSAPRARRSFCTRLPGPYGEHRGATVANLRLIPVALERMAEDRNATGYLWATS